MGKRLTPAQKRANTIARNKKVAAKAKRDALQSVAALLVSVSMSGFVVGAGPFPSLRLYISASCL